MPSMPSSAALRYKLRQHGKDKPSAKLGNRMALGVVQAGPSILALVRFYRQND